MVTFQGTGADINLDGVDSEKETVQFAPLADLLTEEIRERMHEVSWAQCQ